LTRWPSRRRLASARLVRSMPIRAMRSATPMLAAVLRDWRERTGGITPMGAACGGGCSGADGNHAWTGFGPTNAAIHRGIVAAELGDADEAIRARGGTVR
jgi:hypothetical protein